MKSIETCVLAASLAVGAVAQEPVQPTAWDAPSAAGPILVGTVTDPSGRPLTGVAVTIHGGLATRPVIARTQTDGAGHYRTEKVDGARVRNQATGEWDLYVGVCVGSVRGVNPPDYLPWRDLTIENRPGVVVREDFVFDAEKVPAAVRGDTAELGPPPVSRLRLRARSFECLPTRRARVRISFETVDVLHDGAGFTKSNWRDADGIVSLQLFRGADVQAGVDSVTRIEKFLGAVGRRQSGKPESAYEIGRKDPFELLVIGNRPRDQLWILRAADGRRAVIDPQRSAR